MLNEKEFWVLIGEHVTPLEIEGGDYQLLIEALLPLEEVDIDSFSSFLEKHIREILPLADEYDKEDLLAVPDVVIVMQSAKIGRKGNEKIPLAEALGFKYIP